MGAEVVAPPSVVKADINYYLEIADGGTDTIYPGTAKDKLRPGNLVPMDITDLRECSEEFTLDTHGFQFVPHKSAESNFTDDATIKRVVYPEAAELLKSVTGATRVHPFSHLVRRQRWETAVEAAKNAEPTEIIPIMTPSLLCHVDQSYDGAQQVLDQNFPAEEAARFRKTRWAITNIWRPIGSPALRDQLGVCDARSCDEGDLRKVFAVLPGSGAGSRVSRGKGFEVFNVAHNEKHKWYYASRMTPDETLMIKCYDSKLDGTARRTPHTAFQTKFDVGPPRQSIEDPE
ncbi:hypothetical protein GGS23DRAFT_603921 [Durotheca rogersii]|uniref:uncharacterized protein n=1 Tax=Durotheca rogersii TaxID=419775 RepID=UPI00221F5082|nr:uncharacterized protein GGS23DRAFT_603921 [Durotheca rogersii]KAI5865329.1 hypothetical protein GGS23DRAFT_603921 [Durotheca rogersii]